MRERLRLYWSHCGSYRVSHADAMGTPPVRSLDDLGVLGLHRAREGFRALKTNIFCFDAARRTCTSRASPATTAGRS